MFRLESVAVDIRCFYPVEDGFASDTWVAWWRPFGHASVVARTWVVSSLISIASTLQDTKHMRAYNLQDSLLACGWKVVKSFVGTNGRVLKGSRFCLALPDNCRHFGCPSRQAVAVCCEGTGHNHSTCEPNTSIQTTNKCTNNVTCGKWLSEWPGTMSMTTILTKNVSRIRRLNLPWV